PDGYRLVLQNAKWPGGSPPRIAIVAPREGEAKGARKQNNMSANTYPPGPTRNTVRAADGRILTAPDGWILLPPGDAALTRRVKEAGDHWLVQEKKGRKLFSRGVWAPAP